MALTIPLYFLIAVALTALLTAAFRKLNEGVSSNASPQEDEAFERRIARIEMQFGHQEPPAAGFKAGGNGPVASDDARD